jgi:hypothetical protein
MATTGSGGSHTHTYATTPGPAGPKGATGPMGAPGPQGPAGVPDATLAARLAALEARVTALEKAKPPPMSAFTSAFTSAFG